MPEPVSCGNFEGLAVLHALGELEAPVRAAVEEHARACPDCAAILQREAVLADILASGSRTVGEQEPSDLLLSRCRSELSRTLDSAEAASRPRVWTSLFSPREWISAFRLSPRFHPVWSAAALVLVAALSGLAGWEGIGRAPLQQWGPTVMTVFAAPPPPVAAPAPVVTDAAPKASAQNRPAADTTAPIEDLRVYSATDATLNDAFPQRSFAPDARPWRNAPPPRLRPRANAAEVWDAPESGRLAELSRRMETLWWGGVRIDPAEQQKRLVRAPSPEYPEVARRAGIEGQVTLLLRIARDGSVEDSQLLSGEPVLGRAAAEAVEQWRYSPLRIGGRPVSILTSVTFDFELR